MIQETKAEFLLTSLYPELTESWVARSRGTFYRNYSSDILNIQQEVQAVVELARDGYLRLLPQSYITEDDDMHGEDRRELHRRLHNRLNLLCDAFAPIDTVFFRHTLKLEQVTRQMLQDKLCYILKHFYHYDIQAETNPLVVDAAPLLPYVRYMRGDIDLVLQMLTVITGHKVSMQKGTYSDYDNTIASLPMLTYIIEIEDLDHASYEKKSKEIMPLAQFLRENLLPFDLVVRFAIRGNNSQIRLLNYNTTIDRVGELSE